MIDGFSVSSNEDEEYMKPLRLGYSQLQENDVLAFHDTNLIKKGPF